MNLCEILLQFYTEDRWGLDGLNTMESFIQQMFIEHLLMLDIMQKYEECSSECGTFENTQEERCNSEKERQASCPAPK